jgi:hypothetical protein
LKSDASAVISKHESSFESAGCKIKNLGINADRYDHVGEGRKSKRFEAHSICIKFTPTTPNPNMPAAPAAPTAEDMMRGFTGAPAAASGSSKVVPTACETPTEKLLGLKQLLDAGVLTQEEFDQKKGELLGQM